MLVDNYLIANNFIIEVRILPWEKAHWLSPWVLERR